MAKTKLSRAAWLEHLANQEREGETQRVYCQEHGLDLAEFRYWKKSEAREVRPTATAFVEIPVAGTGSEAIGDHYTIEFPNGCALRVHVEGTIRGLADVAALVKAL